MFFMKPAAAIPLKKSRKRKINVFLRGSCFITFFKNIQNKLYAIYKK